MTTLSAAELSRLARIAASPKQSSEQKTRVFKSLSEPAKRVARVLVGETKDAPDDATKTARSVKRWTSRQK